MDGSRIAEVGALLGDETRARLLSMLLDGRAYTVGELARAARVAVSTASGHLARLRDGGLLAVCAQGRYRYYRLSGPQVADLLESLHWLPAADARPREPGTPAELRFARTCYDHLAGALGVALCDRLLGPGAELGTHAGPGLSGAAVRTFAALGVDAAALPAGPRPVVRRCLDWSERRPHLAGSAGAAVLQVLLERRWLVRRRTPRAVRLTRSGRVALTDALGPHPCWAVVTQVAFRST